MLTSRLKPRTLVLLFGITLASWGLVSGVSPVVAQLANPRSRTLSPAAQQMLSAVLAGISPYEQRLVQNAVLALSPERAEQQLFQWMATPAATRAAAGQLVTQILQALPPQYHQAFIDGLFEVSAPEAQFVAQVVNYIQLQVARQGDATRMISDWGTRMRALTLRQFNRDQAFSEYMGNSLSDALGGLQRYIDPTDGWQGTTWLSTATPGVDFNMYRCVGNALVPVPPGQLAPQGCQLVNPQ